MTKSLFVLRDVANFAAGAFENTAVDEGGIQLGRMGTGFLPDGSYTSPPFVAEKFRELIPSWNADTPPGTSIEMQVRVQVQGRWSRWFSFGKWSVFEERSSPPAHGDEMALVDAEVLRVLPALPPAEAAQMRVHLHSADDKLTPTVLLMAAATRPELPAETKLYAGERVLEMPAYSALVRDPAIAARIGGATSLTMLMNRWGADVLPEEVARCIYDAGAGKYENLAFLSAAGGIYDFESFVGFGGVSTLRREVWMGQGIAAQLHYRTPALAEAEEAQEEETKPPPEGRDNRPILPGATVDSRGHLVVVRGFTKVQGEEFVVLNDPLAPSNEAVVRQVPLALFERMYTGVYMTLHRAQHGLKSHKPVRKMVQLSLEGGEIRLQDGEEALIPGCFTGEQLSRSTLCYILSSPVAYASTAQRQFYYPSPDEKGRLKFDQNSAVNRRMTFYRIGPCGRTWVAEKRIEQHLENQTQQG